MMTEAFKNKKILITGGLGFIGSNIALKCIDLGAEVTIYDCLDPRSGGNMHNIDSFKSKINIVLNDLRNFEGICEAVLNKDYIFNCAAFTSHPNAMKEPLIDIDVNCKGTINLLESIRRFNPETKLVHVGTSTQIGKMNKEIVDELHSEFPMDIYSANKSVSEKYVLIYGSAYNLRTTVVRLANNFGPRSCIKNSDFGFINYFIGMALQSKKIPIYGNGLQLRNFSYIDDSVNALLLAAINDNANGNSMFAVSDNQYTIKDITIMITEIIGGDIIFVPWPQERKSIEVGDAVISNNKIKKILDWSPLYNLEDSLLLTKIFYVDKLKYYL
jgi:UDP-glucose 4-epimerase